MKCTIPNCHHNAIEGSRRCERHTDEEDRIRRYRINKPEMQTRLNERMSTRIQNLRIEMELARVLLENRINAAGEGPENAAALHAAANDSFRTIKALNETLTKLERDSDNLLERDALESFVMDAIKIISEELEPLREHEAYPAAMDNIVQRLAASESEVTNK